MHWKEEALHLGELASAVDWASKVGNSKLTQKQVDEIDETDFQHNQSTA